MKEKLIGNEINGFLLTRYPNQSMYIDEFFIGRHYSRIVLSRKEVDMLKEFLNEKL